MLKNFKKAENGAAAVEVVLILPFLLLLYFGLQDLTGLITYNRKITSSASSVADTIAQNQTSVTKAVVLDDFNAVSMIMAPVASNLVRVQVYNYRLNGTTMQTAWSMNNGAGITCTAPDPDQFKDLTGGTPANDVIVAVACMDYVPYVVQFFGQTVIGKSSFRLQQTISSRPRSTPQLDCFVSGTSGTVCS